MNKFILTLVLISAPFFSFGQDSDLRNGSHIFDEPTKLQQCDVLGVVSGSLIDIGENWKFAIEVIGTDYYIIHFFKWNTGGKDAAEVAILNARNLKYNASATGDAIYFYIKQADYKAKCTRLERRGTFTVSASTTLLKIRPGLKDKKYRKLTKDSVNIFSDIANDFNVGIMAGWKFQPYRKLELSHSLLAGVGFSAIGLDSENTNGFLKTSIDQGSLCLSLAYVLEYNKFQVSITTGLDIVTGEAGRYWIYRNRPWVGIGFGYSIFRAQGKSGQ